MLTVVKRITDIRQLTDVKLWSETHQHQVLCYRCCTVEWICAEREIVKFILFMADFPMETRHSPCWRLWQQGNEMGPELMSVMEADFGCYSLLLSCVHPWTVVGDNLKLQAELWTWINLSNSLCQFAQSSMLPVESNQLKAMLQPAGCIQTFKTCY